MCAGLRQDPLNGISFDGISFKLIGVGFYLWLQDQLHFKDKINFCKNKIYKKQNPPKQNPAKIYLPLAQQPLIVIIVNFAVASLYINLISLSCVIMDHVICIWQKLLFSTCEGFNFIWLCVQTDKEERIRERNREKELKRIEERQRQRHKAKENKCMAEMNDWLAGTWSILWPQATRWWLRWWHGKKSCFQWSKFRVIKKRLVS